MWRLYHLSKWRKTLSKIMGLLKQDDRKVTLKICRKCEEVRHMFLSRSSKLSRVISVCRDVPASQTSTLFNYVNNPSISPYTERMNNARHDGYFVHPNARSPRRHWSEYKNNSNEANVADIGQSSTITNTFLEYAACNVENVENTDTRIWFCCRTDVFVTKLSQWAYFLHNLHCMD